MNESNKNIGLDGITKKTIIILNNFVKNNSAGNLILLFPCGGAVSLPTISIDETKKK